MLACKRMYGEEKCARKFGVLRDTLDDHPKRASSERDVLDAIHDVSNEIDDEIDSSLYAEGELLSDWGERQAKRDSFKKDMRDFFRFVKERKWEKAVEK